ncbi:helix-turn-helix domain-containing protein [Pseudomonas sp. Milli4]|uniref:Helix-turn-helix domain-containing protein n=2 Tax=Pseudomonas schmalbachii TaxID=2816993 RepID=A0ABS3TKH4_9PSED|nr:helix-turn-helix domain-containing protein [Pseudomonas schmalbachii]
MDIGPAIRAARRAKEMTLEQLALLVETDTGNLSRLETGKQGVSSALLDRILKALDVDLAAVISGSNHPSNTNEVTKRADLLAAIASPRSRVILQRIAQAAAEGHLTDDDLALLDQVATRIANKNEAPKTPGPNQRIAGKIKDAVKTPDGR